MENGMMILGVGSMIGDLGVHARLLELEVLRFVYGFSALTAALILLPVAVEAGRRVGRWMRMVGNALTPTIPAAGPTATVKRAA